jgi:serine protease inhibitor
MTTRLFLILAVAATTACNREPGLGPITELPRNLTAGEQQLVAANNRFAFAFFGALARQQPADDNLFVSPVSIAMALGMTVNGAGGATRDSMLAALQLGGLPMADVNAGYRGVIDLLRGLDPRVALTLANSIWYRNTIQPGQGFLDDTRTFFDADIRALDFSAATAAQTINDWVNTQTSGKIPEIVASPIPADVIMYLINAIYFKGSWTQQFDPALTRSAPFNLRAGGSVAVPTMVHGKKAPARVHVGAPGDVTVVDLPYGGGAWSMTIVLPPSAAGIDTLVAGLTQARWDGWITSLDSADVFVTMPKYTLRWELELKDVLTTLGMGLAFRPDCTPDFSRLAPAAECPYISKVKHKTFVEVNEEGTEAAAVTSVSVGVVSAPVELRIVVDRPFLVAIRERLSGTILFLGRVTNPAAN